MNYRPSAIARSLVTKKTNKIGMIVLDITNPYQTEIIRGFEEYRASHKLDYNILLIDMMNEEGLGDKYIDTLLENRVDGIATTSDKISAKYVKYLKKIKLPVVFIGRYIEIPNIGVNVVTIDNLSGAYKMTEYLINLGHRKITYVSGPQDTSVSTFRLLGYRKALKHSGIENIKERIIFSDNFTYESGFKAAEEIFSLEDRPTAIFCVNDFSALGVIDFCYKHGIKIPDDVSIAGFDDVTFSSFGFVSLTTVRQPIKKLGKIAAEILFNEIKTKKEDIIKIVLEPAVISRKSTRKI